MRNSFKIVLFSLLITSSSVLYAQEFETLNVYPDYIFNNWVYSREESNSSNQVYRVEAYQFKENLEDIKWTFTRKDDVFFNDYVKGKQGFIPNKPRRDRICNRGGRYGFIPSKRTEGKWKMKLIDGNLILWLNYFEAIGGGQLKLKSTSEYMVVQLRRYKMVLRRLEKEI
ncbi:hypothetical protein [uncultured Zobellia sp.]|uniref:hypothetical protein n=1 Tax=uncultured Zobellia sp. TaxID=255433 RepID=UPI002594E2E2|nr:hypothetical protein [uncultured Zobellia sp.]